VNTARISIAGTPAPAARVALLDIGEGANGLLDIGEGANGQRRQSVADGQHTNPTYRLVGVRPSGRP